MTYLNNLTQEEREELKLKSKLTLEKKKQEGAHLKQDFMDRGTWKELYKKYSLKAAPYYIPCTEVKYLKRALKHLGVEISLFLESVGCKSLKEYAEMNPTWPAWGLVGVLLEWYDSGDLETL